MCEDLVCGTAGLPAPTHLHQGIRGLHEFGWVVLRSHRWEVRMREADDNKFLSFLLWCSSNVLWHWTTAVYGALDAIARAP